MAATEDLTPSQTLVIEKALIRPTERSPHGMELCDIKLRYYAKPGSEFFAVDLPGLTAHITSKEQFVNFADALYDRLQGTARERTREWREEKIQTAVLELDANS